jgi:PIN like domain
MRVLVDEAMPVQVLEPLRLNKGHFFDHVDELKWKGKKDVLLFRDAASKGYEAILTLDVAQLESVDESRALRRSKLHHIGIQQGRSAQGIRGMARVIASVVAAMPYVLDELHRADGQRVVEMSLLKAARRHDVFDPQLDVARFPYWH